MNAADLIADLARLGIRLEAHGDRLRYSPRSAVTPDVADRMKSHKTELLAILCPEAGRTGDVKLARCPKCGSVRLVSGKLWLWCGDCESRIGPTDDDGDADTDWIERTGPDCVSLGLPDHADVDWEMIDLPDPLPCCGGIDFWWDSLGALHCSQCDPPDPAAERCRQVVERHRNRLSEDTANRLLKRPKPPRLVGRGKLVDPCGNCGGLKYYDVAIHDGESVRRDCAFCDRFIAFLKWNDGNQNTVLVEHNVRVDAAQAMDISPTQFGDTRKTAPSCEIRTHKKGIQETEGAITMQNALFRTEIPKTKYKSPTCPLKWHGGKRYDADWITGKMPPHLIFVEPFFGSGKVLFARDPNRDWFRGHGNAEYQDNGELYAKHQGCSEIANDIYGELMNFWAVIADGDLFQQFQFKVNLIPFAQIVFERSKVAEGSDVDRAVNFFVRNRLSRQGLGKDFATMVRNRTRRRMPDPVSAFLSAVEGLPEVHDRLSRVVIFNEDAKDVIQREDNDATLFYLDPPYPRASRTAQDAYEHEMTDDEHHQLLDVLCNCKGKVILSTYPNPIYDERLRDWNHEDRVRDNKASSAKNKGDDLKTERIWMNF